MPQFFIQRLPSGIRFKKTISVTNVLDREKGSPFPPKTFIFGNDDNISGQSRIQCHPADVSSPRPSSGPSQKPERLNTSDFPSDSSSPAEIKAFESTLLSKPEPDNEKDAVDECLPLLNVAVQVLVDGIIARTTLTQRFSNKSNYSIPQARYVFPLYDGAVVIAFKCAIGKDRELIGKVQAKDEAIKQFEKAVKKQQTVALLEEHTPEIFETTIGNIPAGTDVEIQIDYVCEIKATVLDDGEEVMEAIIPMSIAPRYGGLEGEEWDSRTKMQGDGLTIVVKVSDGGRIKKLHCNHAVVIDRDVPVTFTKVPSFEDLGKVDTQQGDSTAAPLTQTIAKYTSGVAFMYEDFVVAIEHNASHPIRSRAVLSQPDGEGFAALMINLKPAEIFKGVARADKFDGEIIFVLDRSGSMGIDSYSYRSVAGMEQRRRTKISTLRNALPLSLASLPTTCRFNVVSFGDHTEFLWRQSKPYTQGNLDYARSYARRIKADMGGTQLLYSLKQAVESRRPGEVSTQIILVTDGEIEPEGVLEFVWNTRQALGDKVRFFALGIGDQVPHRLINRIGEFGGGYGEVIDIGAKPEWADRLSLLLAAAIMPSSWTCEIDLGPGFERHSLLSYRLGEEVPLHQNAESTNVGYITAPYPIPPLHPFAFRSIFIMLDLRSRHAPKQVALKATSDHARQRSDHLLTVETTRTDKSTIQHLAAKAALLTLEADMKRQILTRPQEESAKENAVAIGKQYKVTSRWTSFLAMEGPTTVVDEVQFCRGHFHQGNIEEFLSLPVEPASSAFGGGYASPLAAPELFSLGADYASYAGETENYQLADHLASGLPLHPTTKPWLKKSRATSARGLEFREAFADIKKQAKMRTKQSDPIAETGDDMFPSEYTASMTEPSLKAPDIQLQLKDDDVVIISTQASGEVSEWVADASSSKRQLERQRKRQYTSTTSWRSSRGRARNKARRRAYLSDSNNSSGEMEMPVTDLRGDTDDDDKEKAEDDASSLTGRRISCTLAAESQEAGGLFRISASFREKLGGYFLDGTAGLVHDFLISAFPTLSSLPYEKQQSLVDTIMMIQHFRRQLAEERDLWGMMIDKAELSVEATLKGANVDALDIFDAALLARDRSSK